MREVKGWGWTTIVTSSEALSCESLARQAQDVGAGRGEGGERVSGERVVEDDRSGAADDAPETSSVLPRGSPSSVAVPLSATAFGRVTSRSAPALTIGGSFFRTVMTTSSQTVNSVSWRAERSV